MGKLRAVLLRVIRMLPFVHSPVHDIVSCLPVRAMATGVVLYCKSSLVGPNMGYAGKAAHLGRVGWLGD